MTDNEKALMHQLEMIAHSPGTAQFFFNLIGGGFITNQQAKDTMDFCIAKMKRDIESNSNLNREQKDFEIASRESWFNALKTSMDL